MKAISIATTEEQAGKSALAVHLAHYLRDAGAQVLAIDLDYKGDTSCALRDFGSNMTVPQVFAAPGEIHPNVGITLVRSHSAEDLRGWMRGNFSFSTEQAADQLRAQFAIVAELFDYCVIDTSSGLCHRSRAAMSLSDFLVVPVTPASDAVTKAAVALDVFASLRGRRGQLTAIIPSRLIEPHEARTIKWRLGEQHPDHALDAYISEDAAIPTALRGRVPVWASKAPAARRPAMGMRLALSSVVDRIRIEEAPHEPDRSDSASRSGTGANAVKPATAGRMRSAAAGEHRTSEDCTRRAWA